MVGRASHQEPTMTKYNGHKNWNYWNVSLWIGNDEGLYNLARQHIRRSKTKDEAARALLADLEELGITKTPDGAPYSVSALRAALIGL
jgi:hypothetical protein